MNLESLTSLGEDPDGSDDLRDHRFPVKRLNGHSKQTQTRKRRNANVTPE
jgi:hypothetical protein